VAGKAGPACDPKTLLWEVKFMPYKEDMLYNGQHLDWYGVGNYNATSGLNLDENFKRTHGITAEGTYDFRTAAEQATKNAGPIPEGYYSFSLRIAGDATVSRLDRHGQPAALDTRQGIEALPDHMVGPDKKIREVNVAEWGHDRVRLNNLHIDHPKARGRGGFYLHDSTKGYTHGCVEVDTMFFTRLRAYAKEKAKTRHSLILRVKYPSAGASTYGGTKQP
jgi:hypothetical protein